MREFIKSWKLNKRFAKVFALTSVYAISIYLIYLLLLFVFISPVLTTISNNIPKSVDAADMSSSQILDELIGVSDGSDPVAIYEKILPLKANAGAVYLAISISVFLLIIFNIILRGFYLSQIINTLHTLKFKLKFKIKDALRFSILTLFEILIFISFFALWYFIRKEFWILAIVLLSLVLFWFDELLLAAYSRKGFKDWRLNFKKELKHWKQFLLTAFIASLFTFVVLFFALAIIIAFSVPILFFILLILILFSWMKIYFYQKFELMRGAKS